MKKREFSLDYLRAFACILVTVGHLIMSFRESNIITNSLFLDGFIRFIYCFHVYIFFYCSGYLFQKNKESLAQSKQSIFLRFEKFINYMILYVFFSGVTYILKVLFSSNVNTAIEYSFIDTLINHPINQMWYLYAISLIFLLSHLISSKKSLYVLLGIAIVFKIVVCLPLTASVFPTPLNYICHNMIWFVLGQLVVYNKIKLNMIFSIVFAIVFIAFFALVFVFGWESEFVNATLTFLGLVASVGLICNITKNKSSISGIWKWVSKYMLQIYLLHTIFAACVRTVLFKIGITHILPHLLAGLLASFILPIICAMIAERFYLLNIVFFPTKILKRIFIKNRVK